MEKFLVRPGYKTEELLVEFLGDHREPQFPDIQEILVKGLKAEPDQLKSFDPTQYSSFDIATMAVAADEFLTFWKYSNGEYELDDDIWAFFIHAPKNNRQVISDIEGVLLASGKFIKEEVDFSQYK
ncbi:MULTISPECIES: hypothetical protein [Pseudoalteromonas]|uniref:hypothetical protein n=2 Tax=Pseudoalteromonas TaxID=53246 RepID=UPI001600E82A|nr:hypothetical protein [Pseudoalteromonas sp. SG41-2]MBB1481668.1 hypothetical protein [Pseudoalteromonas sp. SG41-2]